MNDASYIETAALMGTVVTMQIVRYGQSPDEQHECREAITRAFNWFHHVEATCSRFEVTSELRALSLQVGKETIVSPLLFHALHFACGVAEASNGAFDPTVGAQMEQLGFNREYRRDSEVHSHVAPHAVSWRDIRLDPERSTVTLEKPMLLDLGAVAKGLAIDLAKAELAPFTDFAIDAGGDLYLGGHNAKGETWQVGVRHPRDTTQMLDALYVSNRAVCTSGDYERRTPSGAHHLLDARRGASADSLTSVTVIAESAMVADALATAAFALGPAEGAALLSAQGVDALLVSPSLEQITVGSPPLFQAARVRTQQLS